MGFNLGRVEAALRPAGVAGVTATVQIQSAVIVECQQVSTLALGYPLCADSLD